MQAIAWVGANQNPWFGWSEGISDVLHSRRNCLVSPPISGSPRGRPIDVQSMSKQMFQARRLSKSTLGVALKKAYVVAEGNNKFGPKFIDRQRSPAGMAK